LEAAGHWHGWTGLCAALILAFAILRIKCEEVKVAARYPGYVQCAATTWRLIPYVYWELPPSVSCSAKTMSKNENAATRLLLQVLGNQYVGKSKQPLCSAGIENALMVPGDRL
jgi:hypothetical protein